MGKLSLFIFSLCLVACNQRENYYIKVQTRVHKELQAQRKSDDLHYKAISSFFEREEKILRNELSGNSIPSEFKGLAPFSTDGGVKELQFKAMYTDYVMRVEVLNIGCEGLIFYEQFGQKFEISPEKFLAQVKWSAEDLMICTPLEIPKGQKLMLLSLKKTFLKDFDLTLNQNSMFTLWGANPEYAGVSPKLKVDPWSVLKLTFKKYESPN